MADYEVGYGKPPKSRRFQPGVSGNPKGRPKRKPLALAETIVFIALLFVAFVYVWRRGALEWR